MLFLLNTEKLTGWKRHKQFPQQHRVISGTGLTKTGWLGCVAVSQLLPVAGPGQRGNYVCLVVPGRSLALVPIGARIGVPGPPARWGF